jgi:hypothetical protein
MTGIPMNDIHPVWLPRCRACNTAGYVDDNYCSRCGTELPRHCHRCGASIRHPVAYHCSHCGTQLATDAPGPSNDIGRGCETHPLTSAVPTPTPSPKVVSPLP